MNEINSILGSVKKMLGLAEDYEHFDSDIIMHINSVFTILHQLGVGPDDGFFIMDGAANWSDYIGDDVLLNSVKSYMYLKVKILFDPPASSTAMEAANRMISEFEWRLNVRVDP